MIDVMFFLLATFMLASLTLQNLHAFGVSVPAGRAAPRRCRPLRQSPLPWTRAATSS